MGRLLGEIKPEYVFISCLHRAIMHDIFTHGLITGSRDTSGMLTSESATLLEDLAIRPIIGLALNVDRLVPGPLVIEKLLVLSLGGVKLGELVALPVGGDIEGGNSLVTTNQEGTLDDRVVGLAID